MKGQMNLSFVQVMRHSILKRKKEKERKNQKKRRGKEEKRKRKKRAKPSLKKVISYALGKKGYFLRK